MGRAAMGFAAEIVRVIVKMHPILARTGLAENTAVVVVDIMVADIPTPGIGVVIDMIDTKPVVNPPGPEGIARPVAEGFGQEFRQHGVDLIPSVVIGQQMWVDHFTNGRFQPA